MVLPEAKEVQKGVGFGQSQKEVGRSVHPMPGNFE